MSIILTKKVMHGMIRGGGNTKNGRH